MHQSGPDLHGALQRVAGPDPGLDCHTFRMEQRQPGEHFGVEPVALGVFVVIVAQVSGLLGWNHHNDGAVATEPCRQRHPGVACRLHDHGHLDLAVGQFRP